MKKLGAILVTLFLLLSGWAETQVYADTDNSYHITSYYSYVTMYEDGSVYFDEYVTYLIEEMSVEIIKPILMSGASEVRDMQVLYLQQDYTDAEVESSIIPLKLVENFMDTELEGYRFGLASEDDEIYHIKIPVFGQAGASVTYVYRYRLNDVIFIYKDTAAFFWQFILPDNNIQIENVEISIVPPSGEESELLGFIRGSIYSTKDINDNSSMWVGAQLLKAGEYLEVCLLFPNTLVPAGRKIIDNYAKETIITEMLLWENQAERERQRERQEHALKLYTGWAVSGLAVLWVIGIWFILFIKIGRRQRFTGDKDIKELPAGYYTPAELSVLLHKGKIGQQALLATILHLIQCKYMELIYDEKGIGCIAVREDVSVDKLKPHEEYLMNWLIKELGDGHAVALEEVDKLFARRKSRSQKYKVETWKRLVYQKAGRWNFEEKIFKYKFVGVTAALVGLSAAVVVAQVFENYEVAAGIGFLSLVMGLYTIRLKKMSKFGDTHYRQWCLFREYLLTQLKGGSCTLPLVKWEQYFVYAIPLGIDSEVFKGVTRNYKENDFENGHLTIFSRIHLMWIKNRLDGIQSKKK